MNHLNESFGITKRPQMNDASVRLQVKIVTNTQKAHTASDNDNKNDYSICIQSIKSTT